MEWYLQVLRKYTDFSGRSRRQEYWMFVLFNVLISAAITILDYILGTNSIGINVGLFSLIYGLAVLLPGLTVSVRRLHDVGKSGWMLLILLIPLIGVIWLLILFVTDSEPGNNQYGANPKEIVIE